MSFFLYFLDDRNNLPTRLSASVLAPTFYSQHKGQSGLCQTREMMSFFSSETSFFPSQSKTKVCDDLQGSVLSASTTTLTPSPVCILCSSHTVPLWGQADFHPRAFVLALLCACKTLSLSICVACFFRSSESLTSLFHYFSAEKSPGWKKGLKDGKGKEYGKEGVISSGAYWKAQSNCKKHSQQGDLLTCERVMRVEVEPFSKGFEC